jgi:hypothetical protein
MNPFATGTGGHRSKTTRAARREPANVPRRGTSISEPALGHPGPVRDHAALVARADARSNEEVSMAKRARKKKARKKSSANHGKRPNS